MRRFTGTAPVVMAFLFLFLAASGCQGEKGDEYTEMLPGLDYLDTVVGTGDVVGATDFVFVHYTGWLYADGAKAETPFDSSVDRGEPISFPLGRSFVIEGWDKGLVGMRIGGKRTLLIGHEMAYGERGRPPVIPESATLIFDVEIVDIQRVDIEVTEAGTGAEAEAGDMLNVHYTGWLWVNGAKGEQFDSSHKRGQTFQFPLGQGKVIPGWDSAFDGMKVGQKSTLIIPPDLGYGKRGSAESIPPDATLCFEVELVSIEGK